MIIMNSFLIKDKEAVNIYGSTFYLTNQTVKMRGGGGGVLM